MTTLYSVKAKADFDGEMEGDLPLKEGEIIQVLVETDEDWLTGKNDAGSVGIFPRNFVTKVEKPIISTVPSPAPIIISNPKIISPIIPITTLPTLSPSSTSNQITSPPSLPSSPAGSITSASSSPATRKALGSITVLALEEVQLLLPNGMKRRETKYTIRFVMGASDAVEEKCYADFLQLKSLVKLRSPSLELAFPLPGPDVNGRCEHKLLQKHLESLLFIKSLGSLMLDWFSAEYFEAINDYVATILGEMSIREKEIITVLKKDPEGWWIGEKIDGTKGRFPSNYVVPIALMAKYEVKIEKPAQPPPVKAEKISKTTTDKGETKRGISPLPLEAPKPESNSPLLKPQTAPPKKGIPDDAALMAAFMGPSAPTAKKKSSIALPSVPISPISGDVINSPSINSVKCSIIPKTFDYSIDSLDAYDELSDHGYTVERTEVNKKKNTNPVYANDGETVEITYTACVWDGAQTTIQEFESTSTPVCFTIGAGEVIEGLDLAIKNLPLNEKGSIIIAPEKGYGEKKAKDGKVPAKSHLVYLGITILRKGVRGDNAGDIKTLKVTEEETDDLTPKAANKNEFIVFRGRNKTGIKFDNKGATQVNNNSDANVNEGDMNSSASTSSTVPIPPAKRRPSEAPPAPPTPTSGPPPIPKKKINNKEDHRPSLDDTDSYDINISPPASPISQPLLAPSASDRKLSKAPPPLPVMKNKNIAKVVLEDPRLCANSFEAPSDSYNSSMEAPSPNSTFERVESSTSEMTEDFSPKIDLDTSESSNAIKRDPITDMMNAMIIQQSSKINQSKNEVVAPIEISTERGKTPTPLLPDGTFLGYEALKVATSLDGVDTKLKEKYLSEGDFKTIFGMSKSEFNALPKWRRDNAKKGKGLF